MKQMAYAEHAGKRKQPSKELFLCEMDRVEAVTGALALIESHYPGARVAVRHIR